MSASLQLSRSSPGTCAQVRCTSPTGARGPAGTPCRASSAPTAVGGWRDGGDGVSSPFSFPTHLPSPFAAVIRLHLTVSIIPGLAGVSGACVCACVCLRAWVLTCSLTPAAPSARDILSSGRPVPRGLGARRENHISSVSLTFLAPPPVWICFLGFSINTTDFFQNIPARPAPPPLCDILFPPAGAP